MGKCKWCGREFTFGTAFDSSFCSEKCYQEYLASKQKNKQSSYSGQESMGGGCLSFIGKLIKWIIIAIVIFVLVAIFAE